MIDYAQALNEAQYAAATSGDGPVLVVAGAGSGKTRTIVYRLAWLAEHGVADLHPQGRTGDAPARGHASGSGPFRRAGRHLPRLRLRRAAPLATRLAGRAALHGHGFGGHQGGGQILQGRAQTGPGRPLFSQDPEHRRPAEQSPEQGAVPRGGAAARGLPPSAPHRSPRGSGRSLHRLPPRKGPAGLRRPAL